MNRYLQLLLSALLTFIVSTSISCNQEESKLEKSIQAVSIDKIKSDLELNINIENEKPFNTRTFEPFLNEQWIGNAVSYGCYRKGQAPGQNGPSENEILEDLNIISKHWNLIRIYGTGSDAERILKVIKDNNLSIKMMLGVWLEPEVDRPEKKAANIKQVLSGIELVRRYSDIILAVSVGNETQVFWSWHRMNPDNLINYIRAIRNNVSVPVTTADDYNFWNKPESKTVAAEVDFITTHMHPLWNGKQVEESIRWVDEVYTDIQSKHSDRLVIIGETGWATNYNAEKVGDGQQGTLMKGDVSENAQAEYLKLHNSWVDSTKVTTFIFEAFDEPWKGGGEVSGPNEVEKHWGLFYEDRTPKESMSRQSK